MEVRTRKSNLCHLVKSQFSSDLIFVLVDCFLLEHALHLTSEHTFLICLQSHKPYTFSLLCWTLLMFLPLFVGETKTRPQTPSLGYLNPLPMWFHLAMCFKHHIYAPKSTSSTWFSLLHFRTLCPSTYSVSLFGYLIGTKLTTSSAEPLISTFLGLLC